MGYADTRVEIPAPIVSILDVMEETLGHSPPRVIRHAHIVSILVVMEETLGQNSHLVISWPEFYQASMRPQRLSRGKGGNSSPSYSRADAVARLVGGSPNAENRFPNLASKWNH